MNFIIYVRDYGEYDRISGANYQEALSNSGYNYWDVDCISSEEEEG